MKDMLIVGFCGIAGAGKTTLAQAACHAIHLPLIKKAPHYPTVHVERFAGALKDGLRLMGITKEGTPEMYREAAQVIGTDVVRRRDPDHWVKLFLQQLERRRNRVGTIILIDDVRFPNEAAICDLLFYVYPMGFEIPKLEAGRESHASEHFAMQYWFEAKYNGEVGKLMGKPGHHPLIVTNVGGRQIETAQLIRDHILQEHARLWPTPSPAVSSTSTVS